MAEIKTLYLCNGEEPCRRRMDGKLNQYCYANGGEEQWCKHTENEYYAKYKGKNRAYDIVRGADGRVFRWEIENGESGS